MATGKPEVLAGAGSPAGLATAAHTPRSPASAVAWCEFQPRTAALAAELGGRPEFVSGGGRGPLRYLSRARETWRRLNDADPQVVVVISPPIFAPLVAWVWCRRRQRSLVVDCHTGAFHGRRWGWSRPLHWWLARRASAVTVHTEEARALVARWGGRALLLPDDLPAPVAPIRRRGRHCVVLVAGSLDRNEPVAAVLEAARLVPEMEIRLTGNHQLLPARVRAAAPANVVFTGWLEYERFLQEMASADMVAAFSTDPHIMNRAAFEAIGLGRPLVLSGLPLLRDRFGSAALFSTNRPAEMAAAMRAAVNQLSELALRSGAARKGLLADRQEALETLRGLVGAGPLARSHRLLGRRVLMISQHPFPAHPTLRRNVEFVLGQGAQVDLVCTREAGARPAKRAGLRVFAIPLAHRRSNALRYPLEYSAFFLRALPRALMLSARRRYDAVQVDNLPDPLVLLGLPARWRGARLLLYMFELFPEMTAARLSVPPAHRMVRAARWLERFSAARADQVVIVSETCRRVLLGRGVPAAKVSVVHNTQPGDPPSLARGRRRAPVLMVHSTLVARYGVHVAIEAMLRLRASWPDLVLEVLGDGEQLPELRRTAEKLGLAGSVRFYGFLPWPQAQPLIQRATLGLVPVLADGYGELLLPGKLLDYVTAGVPAVCSRLPAIAEHFPEGAVTFFEPGDANDLARAVDGLLKDRRRRQQQVRQARRALQRISWEQSAERYLSALAGQA